MLSSVGKWRETDGPRYALVRDVCRCEVKTFLVARTRLTRLHSEEEMLGYQRLSGSRHRGVSGEE